MRQQWVALLSVLGLTGSGVRVQSQVLKGSSPAPAKQKTADPKLGLKQQTLRQQNQGSKVNGQLTPPPPGQAGKNYPPPTTTGQNNALTKGNSKLNVKQETLRQQNTGGANPAKNTLPNKAVGQNTGTCRYSEGCQTANNRALTKGNQALTKGNQAITKGNQALTKGNQAVTKDNQAITKGNQAITKGNQALTKNNQAITKGTQAVPK